ncbi:MAG: CoA transferase subunit A, partial [Candidatus Lambdaproteobacteria bacterium]|nr:CoA transferase subunit A [Candidatus Lambdaproteobacteria bacterium]
PLAEAAGMVRDGMRVALGGFAVYQHPMAFVRELIRQGRRDLTIVGVANGIELDLLAGAGCLRRVETSYVGLEKFGLAQNFRRLVERGALEVVDYPEMIAWDRFRANQENLTFWPALFLGGTDIVRRNADIKEFPCPLTGRTIAAIPPADPDVVVLHAIAGDRYGNVLVPARHALPQSLDVTLSRACERLIVTVERVVEPGYIEARAHLNQVPAFRTSAIVEVPWGAHPTPVHGATLTDEAHFAAYVEASASDESFRAYLDEYVLAPADHMAYLERIGTPRLLALRDPETLL